MIPREVQQRILEWTAIFNLVNQYFKDQKKTSIWFWTENPLLGGVTPRSMIEMGRYEKLKAFVLERLDERQEP